MRDTFCHSRLFALLMDDEHICEEKFSRPRDFAPKKVGEYVLGELIGKGAFGEVLKATKGNEEFAVKVLQKNFDNAIHSSHIAREIVAHVDLMAHPNLVATHEIIETMNEVFIVMEYLPGGQLLDLLQCGQKLGEQQIKDIFIQLLHALQHMHEKGILHRDVKAENVLLDAKGHIRLIDYGLSASMQDSDQVLRAHVGSLHYCAPECWQNAVCTEKADTFSAGVLLFLMFCRSFPFYGSPEAIIQKMLTGDFSIPYFVSPEASSLIRGMLTRDPKKRLSIQEILNHKWFDVSANWMAKRPSLRLQFDMDSEQVAREPSNHGPCMDLSPSDDCCLSNVPHLHSKTIIEEAHAIIFHMKENKWLRYLTEVHTTVYSLDPEPHCFQPLPSDSTMDSTPEYSNEDELDLQNSPTQVERSFSPFKFLLHHSNSVFRNLKNFGHRLSYGRKSSDLPQE